MRVISGRHRGTKLLLPPDDLIRPTSDRAKEMIFSALNSILLKKKLKFDDMKVLDFFCGTGGLGIECISRGSQKVCFIDNSKIAIDLTKKNLELIKAQKFAEIHKLDFRKLKFLSFKADIFFLDPPYNKFKISEILESIRNARLIKGKSIGIIELPNSTPQNELVYLKIIKEKQVSNSLFLFIETK
jgi:16S rRNA (guanine966-N2)-methyltransferase